jgi:diguanylate cyclase (GGDEF)-like protein
MPEKPATRRDTLKTLFSVAQIQHVLKIEHGRAQRYRYPLVCLAIAIDQLGALRDQHGYESKECVLEAVVALLQEATRSSDFLGRTADDRLVAIIPHTNAAGARVLAQRLLDQARALTFAPSSSGPSGPSVLGGLGGLAGARVTLSIGVSSSESEGSMYHDQLYTAAETALSEASAAGGDRCVERPPA